MGTINPNQIDEFITNAQNRVDSFLWWANASVILACSIAVINIVMPFLDKQRHKIWAIVLAALSVIFVTTNELMVEGDYQTLMHKKNRGDVLINQIKQDKYYLDQEEDEEIKKELETQIFNKINEIFRLHEEYYEEVVSYSGNTLKLPFTENVYAQSEKGKKVLQEAPRWVEEIPQSHANLYYISYGLGETLDKAKSLSESNKVEIGSRILTASFFSNVEFKNIPGFFNLLKPTVNSSRKEDVYFRLDKKTEKYEYFTLYSISKPTLGRKIAISKEVSKKPNLKNVDASVMNESTWHSIAEAENARQRGALEATTVNFMSEVFAAISSGNSKETVARMNKVMEIEKDVTGPTFFNLLYGKFLVYRGECSSIKNYLKQKQIENHLTLECIVAK